MHEYKIRLNAFTVLFFGPFTFCRLLRNQFSYRPTQKKLDVFRLNTIEFHRVGSGGVKSRGRFLSISAMACLITGECVTDVIMNHEKRQAGREKSKLIGRTEEENGSHLLLLVFHHPISLSFQT